MRVVCVCCVCVRVRVRVRVCVCVCVYCGIALPDLPPSLIHLQGNEKRFYELVVRHFLACCSRVSVEWLLLGNKHTVPEMLPSIAM